MRISDWSSDVCSSDLRLAGRGGSCASPDGTFSCGAVGLAQALGRPVSEDGLGVGQALDGLAEALVVLDTDRPAVRDVAGGRSEERRVGKEWVSTCRSRW